MNKKGCIPPHPVLCRESEYHAIADTLLRAEPNYDRLIQFMSDPSLSIRDSLEPFMGDTKLSSILGIDPNRVNPVDASAVVCPIRFQLQGGRIFEFDEKLSLALEDTDIGKQAPCSSFLMPFDHLYIHFPTITRISLGFDSDKQREVMMQGCYIQEIDPDDNLIAMVDQETGRSLWADIKHPPEKVVAHRDYGKSRMIEVTCVSELEPGEDAVSALTLNATLFFPKDREDDPLFDVLNDILDDFIMSGGKLYGDPEATYRNNYLNAITHIAKCLLFITTGDAILHQDNALDDLKQKIERTGPSKRSKLERMLTSQYNKIRVSHTPSEPTTGGHANTNPSRRTHWRRGHFRHQAFGEAYSERKTIWIRPSLISGDKKIIINKTYRVT